MATTEPIRSKQEIRNLAGYYLHKGQLRNYVLVVLGLHTALRISDLLRLRWDDVYDFARGMVKPQVTLVEKKTKKSKTIALHGDVVSALTQLAAKYAQKGTPLILNAQTGKAISRIQAYRLIRAAAEAVEIAGRVSCHSLRKTFGYHAWKKGVQPAIIMDIYNHSSFAVTKRYLGISQDDRDNVYLNLDFA